MANECTITVRVHDHPPGFAEWLAEAWITTPNGQKHIRATDRSKDTALDILIPLIHKEVLKGLTGGSDE